MSETNRVLEKAIAELSNARDELVRERTEIDRKIDAISTVIRTLTDRDADARDTVQAKPTALRQHDVPVAEPARVVRSAGKYSGRDGYRNGQHARRKREAAAKGQVWVPPTDRKKAPAVTACSAPKPNVDTPAKEPPKPEEEPPVLPSEAVDDPVAPVPAPRRPLTSSARRPGYIQCNQCPEWVSPKDIGAHKRQDHPSMDRVPPAETELLT